MWLSSAPHLTYWQGKSLRQQRETLEFLLSGCCLVNSDFNAIRAGQVHPNRSPVSPTLRVLAPCQGQKTNSWMETSTPYGATKKLVEVDLHRLSMLHPSELQKYLHHHST